MRLYIITILAVISVKTYAQNDSIPSTQLTIIQGTDTTIISQETSQITLKTEPFKLVFHTLNTNAVYLNCSYDSTSYLQVLSNEMDSLTCFNSPQTFSEESQNYFHQITIVKNVNRGYHCLFAYSHDAEFVRFDSVIIKNKNNWVGVRTVESLYVLPGVGITSLSAVTDRNIYFVYSPGIEKYGKGLRIKFE